MANLNVSASILSAYPWLERILAATGSCKTRILMVADGDIDFGHHSFGLSRLVEALRQSSSPGEACVVSTALRGEREDGKEADDYLFKFEAEAFGIDRYEQVWLFGFKESGDEPELTEPELKVLAEFMNKGGGVFATGDHATRGFALCGKVPRVRSMRKWCSPKSESCTSPAPPRNEPERLSTVLEGHDRGFQVSDESDDIPQTIFPKLFQKGCEVIPHKLLSFHNGAITILPDHRHEGECVEPTEEQLGQKIHYGNDPEFEEFPVKPKDKTRPTPEVIALSVSAGGTIDEGDVRLALVIPRGFGAICAYDGDDVSILGNIRVGRVVVDASFHHFLDMNLDGTGAPFGRGFFDADGKPTKNYEIITQYFRNIVAYLNPLAFRHRCGLNRLVLLRFMYPLIEEIRSDEALTLDNILEVGKLTRRAISSYFSPAEAVECAVTLLNGLDGHDALKTLFNPRLAPQSEMKVLASLLHLDALINAILGAALLSVAGQLPPETGHAADKLLQIESQEGGLAAGVKDGVSRVASIWEQLVEQAHQTLLELSASSGKDEK